MTTLANRRRPKTYEDVYGNDANIRILQEALAQPKDKRSRVYVLTGSPGSGKTTLARIAAMQLVTDELDIMEINGSAQNKKEDAENLIERIQYLPMSGGARAIIYDEAHMTTAAAWSLLLKPLEDGLEHNYWFICTSEDKKIPPAIRRRAKCIEVKTLDTRTMTRMLARASKEEGVTVPEAIRARIIEISNGSPGQALSHLETVSPLCVGTLSPEDVKEVLGVLREADESSKNLGKALLDNESLDRIRELLKGCQEAKEDPETLRRGVLGYATAALLGGWDRNARALGTIQVFASGTTYDSGFPCLVAMAMTAGGM